MITILSFVIIIIVLGIILALLYSKESQHKKHMKTVRDARNDGYQEPESRYKSVTASLGENLNDSTHK